MEKNPTHRVANENTPGFTHGLNGKHDVFKITEKDIKDIPNLVLIGAGPMCNDFSMLRLLPDRADYNGPPRQKGDPRPGLKGKYGKTMLQTIQIIKWALKHHPGVKFFVENVDFSKMKPDWTTVNSDLGEPLMVDHELYSTTKRRRAYWTNIDIPPDWDKGASPIDPDTCLDKGRKVQRYATAKGTLHTRPLGASWGGRDDAPTNTSNRALPGPKAQGISPYKSRTVTITKK